MIARKHAKVCSGCHEPKRARYRTLMDDYLCDDCYHGARAMRVVAQDEAVPQPATTPPSDAADLEQFDLSHLEHR